MYDQNPLLHRLTVKDLAQPYEGAPRRSPVPRKGWRNTLISMTIAGAVFVMGGAPMF